MVNEAVYLPQPAPVKGQDEVSGWVQNLFHHPEERDIVLDMLAKLAAGERKYGRPLETFNGRNAQLDSYQDLVDAAVYAIQDYVEDQRFTAKDKAEEIRDFLTLLKVRRKRLVDAGVLTHYPES